MEREKRNYGAGKPERGRSPYRINKEHSPMNDFKKSRKNQSRDHHSKEDNSRDNYSKPNKYRRDENRERDTRFPQEKGRKVIHLRRDFEDDSKWDKNDDYRRPRKEYDNRERSKYDRDKRGNSRNYGRNSDNYRRGYNKDEGGEKRAYRRKDEDFFDIGGNSRGYDDVQLGKDGLIRLNKYISNSGICSRREADELIKAGAVTVNGEVVTEMGHKVSIDDVVVYGGERLINEKKKYLLLNKPKGFITTMDDPRERKTVMSLIHKACKERLYPVGRLDRNTTGLLLFTNDGLLTKKLTHPSFGAKKVYHVELDKALTHADMQQIMDGIELEDGRISADDIQYVGDGEDKKMVGIELHSGKNRIVRRIFASLGYQVYKLDRVVFASLTKKNLPRGTFRFLTDKEIAFLKMLKTN